MKPSQESYTPSHPDFVVEFAPGEFSSFLKAKKSFDAGNILVSLEGLVRSPKAYTSVQCGRGSDDHIELNSDFVYVNHSCEPNVAFDLSSPDPSKWHVRALERIEADTPLTFFYPSTEWDMEQAFDCKCGTTTCLGIIKGAKYISKEELIARKWVNPWILQLIGERDSWINGRMTVDEAGSEQRYGGILNQDKGCPSCGYGFSAGSEGGVCGCKRVIT